jgi:glycosyltransferase involved in cell wall biosynthesis
MSNTVAKPGADPLGDERSRMTTVSCVAAPTVSVIMPVYNTEAYLTDSVGSILGQTFQDWELICVDDGSNDGSLGILRRYESADPRVHVITRSNTGVARARNDGIAVARGRYIAAMDSDDVALAERLRRQVDYMESHPECVCLGTAVRVVGPDLLPIKDKANAVDHVAIDCQTLAGSGTAICHPAAMFRTEAVRAIGGYRDECFTCEDIDLYLRLAEIGRLANLPDMLLLWRLRLGSTTRTQRALLEKYRRKVCRDARIRRGLPIGADIANCKEASIQTDDDRGSWAGWSHDAFNGGYLSTARRYAWRALRAEPLAASSWKAILREYFRRIPSG